ncbi:MAG TPA: AgmX/PglI C-terminal domain-containing protein [Kofleriaceae bacterium]|nr:AgmX/PglI C-terminal domain-containing protein [Kofleriaceae bacterium]
MKRFAVVLVTLLACAGGTQEEVKPDVGGPAQVGVPTKKMTSGDVSFEVPVSEIKGTLYEPDALGRPGMPLVDPKRPIPLDKQRAVVQSAKDPVQKQAQAAVLATMLYRDSKSNKDKEKALWTEARQLLRDVAQQVGDQAIDEITLRLLGSYELLLDDYSSAEKAWAALIAKDPKSKELTYNRAYLAYAQLKQFKNAEALATVGTDPLDDKQPELAYVTAWAKWRAGDPAAAWQALGVAAKGWGQNTGRSELEQNVIVFASRGNVALDQAVPVLVMLAKDKAQFLTPTRAKEEAVRMGYELIAKLGVSGYGLVGRWADGIAALDKAVEFGKDIVPANDRVVIRYSQADYTVKLDTPDVAVQYAKQALAAVAACGTQCTDKEKSDPVEGLYLMGRLFHILYATANDKRYYQPAHDLYAMTIPLLPAAQQPQAQQDATKLETTLKNTKAGTGTHDKGALGALLARHTPEVQTCYENAIEANPKIGGTVALMLESDASGAIKGATTEPKAGLADLAAVAGCILEHAKVWKLPRRGMAGTTRIKTSYTFSIKK